MNGKNKKIYILIIFFISDKPNECKKCGRRYKRVYELNRHFRYECQKEKQFQCNVCGKKYFRNSDLHFHLKKIHQPERLNNQITAFKF